LPRNGIGCWHPTFPARSDDIWLAASMATKIIDDYMRSSNVQESKVVVLEQYYFDGIFGGYRVVENY
jgi:hypothetical protein